MEKYYVDNLDSLPTQINNNSICIGGVSSCFNGLSIFFSRYFTSEGTVINGVAHGSNVYNCVEKGYHHMEAQHFNDQSTTTNIMKKKYPAI